MKHFKHLLAVTVLLFSISATGHAESLKTEAKPVVKAFKILQSRINTGISYRDYPEVLSEVVFEVDMFSDTEAAENNPEFTKLLADALQRYEFTYTMWSLKFRLDEVTDYIVKDAIHHHEFRSAYPKLNEYLLSGDSVPTFEANGRTFILLSSIRSILLRDANEHFDIAYAMYRGKDTKVARAALIKNNTPAAAKVDPIIKGKELSENAKEFMRWIEVQFGVTREALNSPSFSATQDIRTTLSDYNANITEAVVEKINKNKPLLPSDASSLKNVYMLTCILIEISPSDKRNVEAFTRTKTNLKSVFKNMAFYTVKDIKAMESDVAEIIHQ
jgi:hypothetical protein